MSKQNIDDNKKEKYVLSHFFTVDKIDFLMDIQEIVYPSLAITNNNNIADFGACGFILNEDLFIKNENANIYDRDAYTIRPKRFDKTLFIDTDIAFEKSKEFLDKFCLLIPDEDKSLLLDFLEKTIDDMHIKNMSKYESLEFENHIVYYNFDFILDFLDLMNQNIKLKDGAYKEQIDLIKNHDDSIESENLSIKKMCEKIMAKSYFDYITTYNYTEERKSWTNNILNNLTQSTYINTDNDVYSSDLTISHIEYDLDTYFDGELVKSEAKMFDPSNISRLDLKAYFAKKLEISELISNWDKIKNKHDVLKRDDEILKELYDDLNNSELFGKLNEYKLRESYLIQILHCYKAKEYDDLFEKLANVFMFEYFHESDFLSYLINYDDGYQTENIDKKLVEKIKLLIEKLDETLEKFEKTNSVYFEVKIKDIMKIDSNNIKAVILPDDSYSKQYLPKFKEFLKKMNIDIIEYDSFDLKNYHRFSDSPQLLAAFEHAKDKYHIKEDNLLKEELNQKVENKYKLSM